MTEPRRHPSSTSPPRKGRAEVAALRTGRAWLIASALVLPLGLAGCPSWAPSTSAEPPNIILVLADDLGYGDLGSYGQERIQTPHLDQLARGGLRLTNMHAGSSVCLPSRCTLMTGMHTGHCRVWRNILPGGAHDPLQEEDITVARVLSKAGYRTGMIGKWALGDEFLGHLEPGMDRDGPGAVYKHGWDYYYGEPNQTYNHEYHPEALYEYDREGLVAERPTGERLVARSVGGRYSQDVLTEKALEFLDVARDSRFFLYVAYQIPHFPLTVPELEPYVEEAAWSERERIYASMITRMDRDVGRIVDRLKEHGIEERTLVLFTSDNGPVQAFAESFNSSGGLPGRKALLTDGGVMVPFIAHWPGTISPGSTSDELLAFWDVLPTLAELGGIDPPGPLDGISFAPTLLGESQTRHHRYLFWRFRGVKRVKKAADEARSDQEIIAEAMGPVVVPTWGDEIWGGEIRERAIEPQAPPAQLP